MLASVGWTPAIEEEFTNRFAADGLEPGRVAVEHRGAYLLYTARGERPAALSGRLRHSAASRDDLPAVGDWVAVADADGADRALVQGVLPRRTKFSRLAATDHGQTVEQVVAANVDVVFLVAGLDGDLNLRRLERYLTLGWESGAEPVVVLTKRDLCDELDAVMLEVKSASMGVPVHAVSNVTGEGIDELRGYFAEGRTVAALGSSGAGKSSLLNRLAGEELMATGSLRADGRGRHTTSHRQLVLVPGGGLYLDTPGMRELRLWESEGGLDTTFDDVASAASRCRFADCAHESEPGCAVQAALADGSLDPGRLASWRKLEGELRHLALKQDVRLRSEARKERARFARSMRRTSW